MKFCPTCHETYGNQLKFCPRDGSSLEVRGLSEDPLVGRMLSDRYEVLERLGAGGFGTVYRVRDTRLDDIEALKVFDRRRLAPNEAMARFEREAKLLRKLGRQSRHIVGVTNFIEDEKEELFYFAMEHVDGANIAQILIREGPLEMTRAITLVKQLCGALDTAHSQDPPIVHRDLKLENLMVRRQGTKEMLKVLDFGIAKIIGHGSLTDLHIGAPGTPGYAAPEQVERPDSIDCRTDLFAVGVVLFGMVTAREPWTGSIITEPTSDGWSLLRATVEGDPIPLRKVREDLPEALEKVIFKLLEKKQEDRFESATALAEALDDVERQMAVDVPGTIRVECEHEGVAINLRAGRRVVAKGLTPWVGRSLGPGDYRVEIADRRFMSEERDVVVRSGEETLVQLSANAKPERPPFSFYAKRAGVPAGVAVVALLGWFLFRPLPELTYDAFTGHLAAAEVVRVEIEGESLVAQVSGAGGSSGDFRVPIAGVGLQEVLSRVSAANVAVRASGEGRALVEAVEAGSRVPVQAGVLALASAGGGGCDPCAQGDERELEWGWYAVRSGSSEWAVDSLEFRVVEGRFPDERIAMSENARVFIPGRMELELTALVSRTELGTLLESSRTALAAGRVTEPEDESALYYARRAMELAPESEAADSLVMQIARSFATAGVTAVERGDSEAAQERLANCVAELGDEVCSPVRNRIANARDEMARRTADSLAQAGRMAEARRRADSVAEAQMLAEAQRLADSITDAQRLAQQEQGQEQELERGSEQPVVDEAERQRVRDSIFASQRLAAQRRRADSIARANAAAEAQRVQDSIANVLAAAEERRVRDSIATERARGDSTHVANASRREVGALGLQSHDFVREQRSLRVRASARLLGAEGAAWCVAARFADDQGRFPTGTESPRSVA